jgi:hypothetical protein
MRDYLPFRSYSQRITRTVCVLSYDRDKYIDFFRDVLSHPLCSIDIPNVANDICACLDTVPFRTPQGQYSSDHGYNGVKALIVCSVSGHFCMCRPRFTH